MKSLLNSIASQNFRGFETILVADGSEAVYRELVSMVSEIHVPNAKVFISTENVGAAGSRNIGAKKASGNIIGFVDDDVVLDRDWAYTVCDIFSQREDVTGLAGAAYPLWDDPKDSWLPKPLDWIISCTGWFGFQFKESRNLWSMNCAVRKEAFWTSGGFDERLGPRKRRETGYKFLAEDLELALRLRKSGYKIYFAPMMKCLHHVQHSQVVFRYIIIRAIWIGRERRYLAKMGIVSNVELLLIRRFVRELLTREGTPVVGIVANKIKGIFAMIVATLSTITGALS